MDRSFCKEGKFFIGYDEGISVERLDREEDLQFVVAKEDDLFYFDF